MNKAKKAGRARPKRNAPAPKSSRSTSATLSPTAAAMRQPGRPSRPDRKSLVAFLQVVVAPTAFSSPSPPSERHAAPHSPLFLSQVPRLRFRRYCRHRHWRLLLLELRPAYPASTRETRRPPPAWLPPTREQNLAALRASSSRAFSGQPGPGMPSLTFSSSARRDGAGVAVDAASCGLKGRTRRAR